MQEPEAYKKGESRKVRKGNSECLSCDRSRAHIRGESQDLSQKDGMLSGLPGSVIL